MQQKGNTQLPELKPAKSKRETHHGKRKPTRRKRKKEILNGSNLIRMYNATSSSATSWKMRRKLEPRSLSRRMQKKKELSTGSKRQLTRRRESK